MKHLGIKALLIFVITTTIGCDRVTKHAARTMLMGEPGQSYLGGAVRLEYAENPGAFLSMGAGLPDWIRTSLLTIGPSVILILMIVMAVRYRWSGLPLIGLAFLLAGGFSNLVDRIIQGSGVDFMIVGIGSLRTGIFNVADVAVMAGVLLIALSGPRTTVAS